MSAVSICIRYGALLVKLWTIIEGFFDGCSLLDLYEGVKSMKFDLGSWTLLEKLLGASGSVSVGRNKNGLDAAIITNKVASTIPIFGHKILALGNNVFGRFSTFW